jgi:hypothetical protein
MSNSTRMQIKILNTLTSPVLVNRVDIQILLADDFVPEKRKFIHRNK